MLSDGVFFLLVPYLIICMWQDSRGPRAGLNPRCTLTTWPKGDLLEQMKRVHDQWSMAVLSLTHLKCLFKRSLGWIFYKTLPE